MIRTDRSVVERDGSRELAEVFVAEFEAQLHVLVGLCVLGVRTHHPPVHLLRELSHSPLLLEPLLQYPGNGSVFLDI